MNELEQAEAVREEARQLLKQSKRFSDLALTNQRRMVFALSSLLPQPITMSFKFSQDDDAYQAEQVAVAAEELRTQMKNSEVFDIVHAINVLAMANADVIHIHTTFAPHVNWLDVTVIEVGTDYSVPNYDRLLSEEVFLDRDDSLERLLQLESKITELVIEAREEAEAKAEVEA